MAWNYLHLCKEQSQRLLLVRNRLVPNTQNSDFRFFGTWRFSLSATAYTIFNMAIFWKSSYKKHFVHDVSCLNSTLTGAKKLEKCLWVTTWAISLSLADCDNWSVLMRIQFSRDFPWTIVSLATWSWSFTYHQWLSPNGGCLLARNRTKRLKITFWGSW